MGAVKKNIKYKRYVELAKFLKLKRIEQGLSQAEVARALGFSSSQFISNWERGMCSPPLNSLQKLTRLLEIKDNEIIKLLMGVTKRAVEDSLR
jgi:transcriptional regulator with XRE-family HTH domain